jgi:hypothetical protein
MPTQKPRRDDALIKALMRAHRSGAENRERAGEVDY